MVNTKWSYEEIERLVVMRRRGYTYQEISKEIGRSVSACYTMTHNIKHAVDPVSYKIRRGDE